MNGVKSEAELSESAGSVMEKKSVQHTIAGVINYQTEPTHGKHYEKLRVAFHLISAELKLA